jgi:hypothetical protein
MFSAPGGATIFFFLHARYFQVAIAIMSMPATRSAAEPATEARIKQNLGVLGLVLFRKIKVFSHHEAAFERVQRYAFANGFAIVESQVCTHAPGGRSGY